MSTGWAALPAGISTIVGNPTDHSAYGRATGGLRALLHEIEEHGPLAG